MRKFKKLNIAIILLLLVFQTVLSPISVFAIEDTSSTPLESEQQDHNQEIGKDGKESSDITSSTNGEGGTEDKNPSEDDKNPSTVDKDPSTVDESPSTVDKDPSTEDKNQSTEDKNPSEDDLKGEGDDANKPVEGESPQPPNEQITPGLPVDREDIHFKEKITLKINGAEVSGTSAQGKVGDFVEFRVDLGLAPGHQYSEGSTLTYTLPSQFAGLSGDTPLYYQGALIGNVVVSGQTATLTFTDKIRDEANAGTIVEDVYFTIKGELQSVGDGWLQNIEVPGYQTIELNFQPANSGQVVSKSGKADRDGKNSEFITWTVDVNTNLDVNSNTGNTIFTDTLINQHSFEGIPTVTELSISPTGAITEGKELTPAPPTTINDNTMTIDLPNKEHTGYRITYKTKVGDPGNVENANFGNVATYNGTSTKPIYVNVEFGTPLEKSSSGPNIADLTTEWNIKYNFNKRNIPAKQAILSDTWDETQILVGNVDVYEENGTLVAKEKYNLTHNRTNGFELSFNDDVTGAYVIKYKTKPADGVYPTTEIKVKNTVTREDGLESIAYSHYKKNELVLDKSALGVDYQNKTISWKIVANQAKYALKAGTIFEDTYGDSLLKLKDGSLTVTVDGKEFKDFTLDKTEVDGKEKGFILKLEQPVNGVIEINYTTDYEIKDIGTNDRTYTNTVKLKDTGIFTSESSDSATQKVKEEQKANGKKDGYYNYETKTFHWDVELNFNYNTFENAIFKDTLDPSQEVTSITVTEGQLNAAGQFEPVSSKNYTNTSPNKNEIVLELGSIKGPYKVTYTSKDADGVFPHGSDITISNKAALYENTSTKPNAEWEKDVSVSHTKNILDKTGKQVGNSPQVNWSFKFNYAQSQLNNIVITDTVDKDSEGNPNQLILKDSFKVYEMNFTGTNPTPTRGKEISLSDANFNVDIEKGTFTLKLPNGDKAYYVTYSTVFMGASGESINNTVDVAYTSTDGDHGQDVFNKNNFTYDGGGKVGKVPFVIIKTDAATGLPMENVKFDLLGPYTGNTVLASKTTNADGYLNYGLKLAPSTAGKKYKVIEETQPGYEPLTKEFELDEKEIETSGKYAGFQVIEIENKPLSGLACKNFGLTVYDIDGKLVNGTVTLVSEATGISENHPVENGKVTFTPDQVKAGQYDVYDSNGNKLGNITVKYDDNCKDENVIQPAPKCENFTIVVEDTDGNIRTNIKELTLKSGTTEVKASTDTSGKFIFESNKNNPTNGVKPGEYLVYEGKQFLGTVNLTYTKDCGHEFIIKQLPKCEEFKLTVKDVDGNKITDNTTKIVVKDAAGKEIINTTTKTGVIVLRDLDPGTYTVEVGGEKIGTFQTNIECEKSIQPAPKCELFTLTVKDENNKPRPNVSNITIKDETGAIIATNQTTNELGQITIEPTKIPSGKYRVYQGDLFIGQITVKYSERCNAEISAAPACPEFTLTVQTKYGMPNANAKITVKDTNGNIVKGLDNSEVLTTSITGTVVLPNEAIKQGTYYVYEGSSLIGSFTVKDTCSALVKPNPDPGPGPGTGPNPDPGPGPGPGPNPGPGPGPKPEPEKPVDPNKPKPEPEKPVDPNKPKPEPEKPVDPNKPAPEPEKPVDPNKPNPEPEKPVDPENPGNPTTDSKNPTKPGKPSVQEVIDQGKDLKPYNPSTANKDTLDAYKDFLDKYNKLSKEEQEEVAKSLDIDKIKADAKEMEAQLKAQGKLPQTNGANQTALTLIGVALVLGALFLLRRRNTEVK
ncbi:collagen binding domain-containing protein [Lysinibacillus sp. Ag94]|uniref:collagen binding domain-containing protein n=1 Tax=Lysinibacillus sp. Ag94 TaxID=2936682 RepID=UPI00200FC911|nr:collagen binding domain-containing protein [Lysinibacillus sp. Ag94]UPW83620.1 LPXTG cell wall anchor domain-containing protein [Lysinibacillus sp. Ag94]